jgi:hypothetical protein
MLFLSEDKGLRGQRPSKSKTIEEQSRFFMDTSESLNVIGFAVFLNLYEKRAAALRTSPTSQIIICLVELEIRSIVLKEDEWLRGQRPSKSNTIEEQSCFFMETLGSLNVIDFAVFLNLYEKRADALRTSPTSQHYNLPR